MPPLIAITGLAGSGKSTIARVLTEHYYYQRVRFADPLKRMLSALGLSHAELDGDLKETPSELLLGATPRHAMQTLGTEWGRNLIGQDIWTTTWKGIVRTEVQRGYKVVCDDLRFLNEAVAVRALGGEIWSVRRPGVEMRFSHQSEAEMSRISFDKRFTNDAAIGDLVKLVRKAVGNG